MAGVEDRVVSMSFDNAKFKSAIAETLAALTKLNASLKFDASKFDSGTTKSVSALDKLKAALKFDSSKFKSDTDATSASLGKLKTSLGQADGKGFQEGTEKSVGVLGRLKAALHLPGATKGLNDVGTAAKRISFDPIGKAAGVAGTQISAMSVVAITALSQISSKAIAAGGTLVKSLTIGPISGGLSEYQTNLNSVQTILSNTAASGAKLKDVNAALKQLNEYSDKTIYNFSQMAKNIGTFTAAGVDLKTATTSIKGIANLAALSGSNSEQASTAMYQLSQAISAGKVGLQDWNSVVNAGMGGTVFQRALATTAERMGTLSKGSVELKGKMKNVTIEGQSFRESITAKPGEKSWLTSDVLTSTLKQLSGDMTDAQLKAEGFSKSQIKAIQAQAKMAVAAATEVKTLSGVLDTAKESAGSGWAETWQIIFGDFGEAKTLFTATSTAINGFIGASADARNKVLGDWKELGGRTLLIQGIKDAFEALKSVVAPIKAAFREIFPAKTGADLANLTAKFANFMKELKIGPLTATRLQSTFVGLFSILSIGKQIIGGIFIVIKTLFDALTSGSGDVLKFTSGLGNSLSALNTWLKEGDRLKNFFKNLGQLLTTPVRLLGEVKDVLVGFFDGIDAKDASTFQKLLSAIRTEISQMGGILNTAKAAWDGFAGAVSSAWAKIKPALAKIGEAFADIAGPIVNAIKSQNFDSVFTILQTTLIGGIFLTLKKALSGGLGIDVGGGLLKNLSGAFETLTGSLKTMQGTVQAATILQIAAAMAILAIAVVTLSKVDGDDLKKSMTAIAVGFAQLIGALTVLSKVSGVSLQMPFIAASLISLGLAINVLALAVKQMSGLSWQELAKGLAGVIALLVGLSVAIGPLSKASGKLILTAGALILVGVALNIMAAAVKIFATMSWEDMAKGLLGLGAALGIIGLALTLVPPSIIGTAAGLVLVGVALGFISAAVAVFGKMSWDEMGQGLLGVASALILIGAALTFMPPHIALQAAGLVLVGIALGGISAAVALMGNLNLGTLAKGIGAIAAVLVVLALGLTAMIISLPGAAALLVAAAALAVLAPVIGLFGKMSWGTIIKGLVAVGLSLIVLGAAGLIAAPALLALAVALGALGLGVLAIGAGVNLLAKGLALMASDGAKGVAVLIAAITGLIVILPKMAVDFAKGLLAIIKAVTDLAPQIVEALAKIVIILVDTIIKVTPKIGEAMTALIQTMLRVIRENFPDFVTTGFDMLMALLQGIDDNIEQVTNKVIDIVEKFLKTLANRLPLVSTSGAGVLAALMKGISDRFSTVVSTAGEAITKFISGVVATRERILSAGATALRNFVQGISDKFATAVASGRDLASKIIQGVTDKANSIISSGTGAVRSFAGAVSDAASTLVAKGKGLVTEMVSGISSGLSGVVSSVSGQLSSIGSGIVSGIAAGIRANAGSVLSALGGVVGSAIDAAKKKLHINSPSKVFMAIGKSTMVGMQMGITNNSAMATDAVDTAVNSMIDTIARLASAVDDNMDIQPVITPVLDLTSIQTGAKQLNGMLNVVPITAAASYGQAAAISSAQAAQAADSAEVAPAATVTEIKFEQTNNSPESLTDVEIYRQTRNLLSQAKTSLGIVS